MNELELTHKLRETAFTMKGMAVIVAVYSKGEEWQTRAKELEKMADMVMSWSCHRVEGREWP